MGSSSAATTAAKLDRIANAPAVTDRASLDAKARLWSALGGGRCSAAVRERRRDVADRSGNAGDRDVDERRMAQRRRLGQRRSTADRGADQAKLALRVSEPTVARTVLAEMRDRVLVRGRPREREQ